MITVSLYGLYRLQAKEARYELGDARDVRELLQYLEAAAGIPCKELKKAVIFVNGTPIDKTGMFRTKLHGGDRVSVLSPASGG